MRYIPCNTIVDKRFVNNLAIFNEDFKRDDISLSIPLTRCYLYFAYLSERLSRSRIFNVQYFYTVAIIYYCRNIERSYKKLSDNNK